MTDPAGAQDPIRFGNDFVLDLRAYELRRAGHALKLERIPMELLVLLVERRGQLVTREQIVERIWGKGVSLDSDNSINGAVRKVRQALRDDPEKPRAIQTITGKGYRFIAPVIGTEESKPRNKPTIAPTAELPRPLPVRSELRTTPRRGPVVLVAAATLLAATAIWHFSPRKPIAPRTSGQRLMLAVLPFQNLTGDSSQEYLSDGLTEEVIAQLGNLDPHGLGVIARTSVMSYKNKRVRLDQIGRELSVQFVLEGSVRRDGDRVRVSADLVQLNDQTRLWAREYDREPGSLLALQSEIAREVTDEIRLALGERSSRVRVRPVSPPVTYEAYDLCLRAQYLWNERTIQGLEQAIDLYQQAVVADPHYARAYAGLANAYVLLGPYTGQPQVEFISKARAAALRALELDPNLPDAHAALGLIVQSYDWDWNTAEKEYRRAIELNPSYATGHHWYAEHLAFRGRFDEALAESELARRVDPLSLIIAADNAMILYYSHQYERAIAKFDAVLALDPGLVRARMVRYAYVESGRYEEALADIDESARSAAPSPWHWSALAYVYGRAGRRAEAEHALAQLLKLVRSEATDPAVISWAYVGMGRREEALAWLEKAYAHRSNVLTTLKVEPGFDALRDDSRFQDLVRRVGLSK